MRIRQERKRDNQQWILDYLVQKTGRAINFEFEEREFPPYVRNYAQIPRALGKIAAHREAIGDAAFAAGHKKTALYAYHLATQQYHRAQHTIFDDDNKFKIYYHGKLLRCFDQIIKCADYPIERVEIPWEGHQIQANFHFIPGRPKAPCVVCCPGMDITKEWLGEPIERGFTGRGMHAIAIDGPGQGTSNLRKMRITDDNYERAVKAVVDYLQTRKEVDGDKIGLLGTSMGCHWGIRAAALDSRIKAAAVTASTIGDKIPLFEQSSPRFKQMFMYMAGIHDEAEFDKMAAKMTTTGYGKKIKGAMLLVVGEYDPLSPIEAADEFFEELAGPKELWVLADYYHMNIAPPHFGNVPAYGIMGDWLKDALDGKLSSGHSRYVYIPERGGVGPYTAPANGRASTEPNIAPVSQLAK
jgi:alpha-beta hydrolase superfamily lysophospholipase